VDNNFEWVLDAWVVNGRLSWKESQVHKLATVLTVQELLLESRLWYFFKGHNISIPSESAQKCLILFHQSVHVSSDKLFLLLTRRVVQCEFKLSLQFPVFMKDDLGQISSFLKNLIVSFTVIDQFWRHALVEDSFSNLGLNPRR